MIQDVNLYEITFKYQGPKDFMNLLEIFKKPGARKIKTVGLILDATCQYKTQTSRDYITKLKIIDEGLNQDASLDSQKKYIHIFIFSKKQDQGPKIARIGDIIYLKRYDFSVYQEEVKGTPNLPANPCYYIFDGDHHSSFDVLDTNSDFETDYYPNEYLQRRIEHLRQFSLYYFKSRLITRSTNWFGTSDIIMNENRKQDFDMLLKIKQKVQDSQNSSNTRFELVDGKNQLYYISLLDKGFPINTIVKIRSIVGINDKLELQTNDYTTMLMIPKHFYDYKRFDENYFLIHEPRMEIENEQEQANKQGVEDDYDTSQKNTQSFIKKSYRGNKQFKDFTQLKKLIEYQDSYRQKTLKDREIKGKRFRVQCYIVDVKPEKFVESLLYNCQACNLSYNHEKNQKICCGQNCQPLYEIQFWGKDQSIENDRSIFEFFLYSLDQNGQDFFPEINLNEPSSQLQRQKTAFNNHVKILKNETSLENYCEFIVEACAGDQILAFRIVDSQLKSIN